MNDFGSALTLVDFLRLSLVVLLYLYSYPENLCFTKNSRSGTYAISISIKEWPTCALSDFDLFLDVE